MSEMPCPKYSTLAFPVLQEGEDMLIKDAGTVAVVTLSGSFNYGNMLQKSAVQYHLKKRGFEPMTFEFVDLSLRKKLSTLYWRVFRGAESSREKSMSNERRRRFNDFRSNLSVGILNSIDMSALDGFDVYVSGSDQVWNPSYIDRFRSTFLPFAPAERRVALSASFGVEELPVERVAEFERAIGGFAHISVREEAGANIVESLTGRRPLVLCDPTLAVSRAEWEHIADDSLNPVGPYMFAYLLGEDNAWRAGLLRDLAARLGVDIVRISDRDSKGQLPAGPAEFIALIADARYVVTDSFHCALFAAMFERPLTIVRRNHAEPSMFSRLETLSSKLGLEGKIVGEGGEPDLNAAAEYSDLKQRVDTERAAFDAYLDEALCRNAIHK